MKFNWKNCKGRWGLQRETGLSKTKKLNSSWGYPGKLSCKVYMKIPVNSQETIEVQKLEEDAYICVYEHLALDSDTQRHVLGSRMPAICLSSPISHHSPPASCPGCPRTLPLHGLHEPLTGFRQLVAATKENGERGNYSSGLTKYTSQGWEENNVAKCIMFSVVVPQSFTTR